MAEELGISATEQVKAGEQFGGPQGQARLAGIGGTLHITDEASMHGVVDSAWNLSGTTKKPVIIVVKHP